MRTLPEALLQKQELQRQATINSVLRAITSLTEEGYDIKIKDLIEITGLSRSAFSKEHIRKILIKHGIGFKKSAPNDSNSSCGKDKNVKQSSLKKKLAQKDTYIKKLVEENKNLKEECELLRGRLFLLMQRQSMDK